MTFQQKCKPDCQNFIADNVKTQNINILLSHKTHFHHFPPGNGALFDLFFSPLLFLFFAFFLSGDCDNGRELSRFLCRRGVVVNDSRRRGDKPLSTFGLLVDGPSPRTSTSSSSSVSTVNCGATGFVSGLAFVSCSSSRSTIGGVRKCRAFISHNTSTSLSVDDNVTSIGAEVISMSPEVSTKQI